LGIFGNCIAHIDHDKEINHSGDSMRIVLGFFALLTFSSTSFAQSTTPSSNQVDIIPTMVSYKITGAEYHPLSVGGIYKLKVEGAYSGYFFCRAPGENVLGTVGTITIVRSAAMDPIGSSYEFRKVNPYRRDLLNDTSCDNAYPIIASATPDKPVWVTVNRTSQSVLEVRDSQ
jgi:hypothetical protein